MKITDIELGDFLLLEISVFSLKNTIEIPLKKWKYLSLQGYGTLGKKQLKLSNESYL